MNKKVFSFLVVIIFVALSSFLLVHNGIYQKTKTNDIQYVTLAGVKLKVELALTSLTQTKGLSGRSGLEESAGMLFIFDYPGKYPFWMKDMNFPIDIIWIGKDKKIIYIQKDASPASFPQLFGPDQETLYVIEIVSGFSDKNHLKVGDNIIFTY